MLKQIEVCKARLIKPLQVLQNILDDPNSTDRSKIEAARVYQDTATRIIQLEDGSNSYREILKMRPLQLEQQGS